MYQFTGTEFSDLIDRKFTEEIEYKETKDQLENIFACSAVNIRNKDFDILNFKANFKEEVYVKNLYDTTHISMHFQLSGSSNATISGFADSLPMYNRSFNLMNCVDPVSSFLFPEQQNYEYLCIGLKPTFFNNILIELGENYEEILNNSLSKKSFSLFNEGKQIDAWQMQSLKSMFIPVSDDLKQPYLISKIKELLLLSFNTLVNYPKKTLKTADEEKLRYAKQYIEQNYLKPLTLALISKETMLNEFKLKSGFKSLFNTTVFSYIHQLRMQYANDLLENSNSNVSETAAMVGYSSDSAFVRAFSQYFGFSPGKSKR